MKGLFYDLKLYKAILRKARLAPRFWMIKYRKDWPEPVVKHDRQVIVETSMCGICASDLHQILVNVPYSASILARKESPFPLGHEAIGTVIEVGKGVRNLRAGDRVAFSPIAHCDAYGFEKCPSCQKGRYETCSALLGIGDGSQLEEEYGGRLGFGGFAGGGFCERFVAFEEQLLRITDEMPNNVAVLTEPFSVAIHAVMRRFPKDDETVLVIGAGVIGLLVIAAIRLLGSHARIITTARYPFQAEKAKSLGSDIAITERDADILYERIAALTGGTLLKPALGKRILHSAAPEIIIDTIGSGESIDDALHLAGANGTIILLGMSFKHLGNVSWDLQVYKELEVLGSMMHGSEVMKGEQVETFEIAVRLLKEHQRKFETMVTHKFDISEYKRAFATALQKGKHEVIKAVFDFEK